MTPLEEMEAYYNLAVAQGAGTTAPSATANIRGRFLTVLLTAALEFWARHKDTLLPYLEAAVVAALDLLVAHLAQIKAINPRGPA